MMKTYKFKLKTKQNPEFVQGVEKTLELCRELYNAALEERKNAWTLNRVSINRSIQSSQLPEIKGIRPEFLTVHSQVLQDVLARVDKAFEAFFRRINNGETPGSPRFKSFDRYDSFTYPQSGFTVDGTKLTLSKIGSVRMRLSRAIEGRIKTCTIKREAGAYYVTFTFEPNQSRFIPKTGKKVGIDLGLHTFAALSTGDEIVNPRFYRTSEAELAKANQVLARKKKKSNNRKKAKIRLQKVHRKIADQRKDFAHKEVNKLIERFDEFHVEDLNLKGMVRHPNLSKSIHDASWNLFVNVLTNKVEETGRKVIRKVAAYTSQTCSDCGQRLPEKIDLSVRLFVCPFCGLTADRDTNAAINILNSEQVVKEKSKTSGYGIRKYGRTARLSGASAPRKESPTITA